MLAASIDRLQELHDELYAYAQDGSTPTGETLQAWADRLQEQIDYVHGHVQTIKQHVGELSDSLL